MPFPVDADGVWRQVLRPCRADTPLPALFLDRDGTIVEEVGHLRHAEDVRLIPGAAAVIASANRIGLPVVIVTNQSGIGRGLFDWADFAAVQARTLALLATEGASIDAVLACPHHPDAAPPWRHADHPARKPNPGMLRSAASLLPIDLAASWIVGDRASDLAAGLAAGLAGGLHLTGSWGADRREQVAASALSNGTGFQTVSAPSLASAPALLPLFTERSAGG